MPDVAALKADTDATLITFPQCALGATAQTRRCSVRDASPPCFNHCRIFVVSMRVTDTLPGVQDQRRMELKIARRVPSRF
eukprot:3498393-Pleurochrysis_carterae.AAC.1